MEKQSFDPTNTLEIWYQEYRKLIAGFIKRYATYTPEDVEDLVEDTFQHAYRSLFERDELPEYPKNWLLKIAENACKRHYLKTSKYTACVTAENDAFVEDDSSHQPENIIEQKEAIKELDAHLRTLPEEQARAVRLHYLEEMSFARIAAKYTDRAPSTVGRDAQRGIEQLRIRLTHVKH